jgi:DNA-binding NtrC family response regulator
MARILVIDDDKDMRALLALALTSEGHEVVSASNGREGFKECLAKVADLVITDLYMPDRDGMETIHQFREVFPEVPIIAMSGKTSAETMLSISKKLGAVEGLQKPFLQDELLAAVKKALAKG